MSLSDCPKCWDTPCTCGWEYREWSKERRIRQAAVVLGITPEELENVAGKIVPDTHPTWGSTRASSS